MIYVNRCGKWSIEVSEPHPAWVTLSYQDSRGDEPTTVRHGRIEDLTDLRHLIDRAIAAADCKGVE